NRLRWPYRLEEIEHDRLVEAVSTGRVDLALSPAPVTLENEELVDFTHAYYSSGLCVAVAHRELNPWRAVVTDLISAKVLLWVVGMLAVLVAVGTAVWLAERQANKAQFGPEPRSGIGDGIWWAAVTLTTVGYGDKVPRTVAGRLLAVFWLFIGVFLLAAFTGHISSTLTMRRLGSPIQSPQDLAKHRIAVVAQSAGAEYLLQHHIRSRTFPDDEAALLAVGRGEVAATVASEPLLRYRLLLEQSNRFDVLPFSLDRRDYALLVANGSPLREPLNRQILHATTRPAWRELLFKYFEQ
ncbi:MAG TPA: transporter substrate-binding domain-containing protein, partial [Candidatus Limnocylindria bacterium]|nr:transporter substrate-binding domain-containing protein [Candidatus Limnocylindria bacterium]